MPSSRLPDIEEVPNHEGGDTTSVRLGGSARELETDYYLGGYDIDSDFPPPQDEEFLSQEPLPGDYGEQYGTLPPPQPVSMESTLSSSSGSHARPHFHPSQYLPPHSFPGEGQGAELGAFGPGSGSGSLSTRLSANASSSDVSAACCFDDSEAGVSDLESADELQFDGEHPQFIETHQQTEV